MKICPVCKTEYALGEVFCPVDAARLESHSQLTATQPGTDPLIGKVLADRYKIIRLLGEGGMGLVYEAFHASIEKRVAVKLLRDDFSSKADVVERFRQEAKSASRIGHAHIVDISDFGETPTGAHYFVMEFLEGEDLSHSLARDGTLKPERAVAIAIQCCRALGAAHAKGIVHRDMKPENIFLTRRDDNPDFVKIVDFGIAKISDMETDGAPGRKLTKTGMIFGTPEYMSPEQSAGKPLDHRVDIYAMGVILFELVTGRVPFVGDSFMGILTQHMFEAPPKLVEVYPDIKIPHALEAIIYKCLAKDANDRFQTMDELADALLGVQLGRPMDATLMGFSEPVKAKAMPARKVSPLAVTGAEAFGDKPASSRAGVYIGGAVVLLGAGAVAMYFALRAPEGTVAPDAGTPVVVANDPPVVPDAASSAPVVAAVQDAGPHSVELRIETRPNGAEVMIEGTDFRCSPTPCVLSALSGTDIIVHAESGRLVGSMNVTPTGETMAVQIALAPRTVARPTSGMMPTAMQPAPTRMQPGDLKIPDIFR